jgi:hypothetical protein
VTRRLAVAALLVILTLAAVGPIRNYDFFWHLATGRWISEHHALPKTDPFAVASDKVEWVNGEWLFELLVYAAHSVVGLAGLSWIRALMIAAIFVLAFHYAAKDNDPHAALMLTALSFAGAMQVIDLRPSGIAALLVVLAIAAARANNVVLYAILTVLWINIHPSALIAPAIALAIARRPLMPMVSAAALLVNPFGIKGVIAPLRLMSFVSSGAFINAEWLPSNPYIFPLLYITIIFTILIFIYTKERELWRIALAVLFAYLAVRHVRHQALWFAAFPMLIARVPPMHRAVSYLLAGAAIALVAVRGDHTLGVSPSRFPVQAVARLKETGLKGNIYNPDQFGGFLIWSFYGERRTLNDGRNELYHSYIPEYARARRNNVLWNRLLIKYNIVLAVDEYRRPMEVLNKETQETFEVPASLVYWPRREWALIAYDRAGMVFARRVAFPPEVIAKWELRVPPPDLPR